MSELKIVISDPKTGKSYQKENQAEVLFGKKVGEKLDGDLVGLKGYELEITGGSDKAGFPMRPDLDIPGKKKALLTSGPGIRSKEAGLRKRKTVRGNNITTETAQVNLKVLKVGAKKLEEVFGSKETKPEEKADGSNSNK